MNALVELLRPQLPFGEAWSALSGSTVLLGALASAACALVGSFLVLRRLSLLGDALSHAVLPGLVIGFLVSGSRAPFPMILGAVAAGLATSFLTQWLHRTARVDSDAAMGTVFATLFAVGVLLISRYAAQVDLDPGCVLYGEMGVVALDRALYFGGLELPRAAIPLAAVLALNVVVVVVLWKELELSAFDPALSTTLGISAGVLHYTTMILVSITSVASFESVGSILVIAMLIVPAATAQLLTDRLRSLVLVALAVGVGSSVLGSWLAVAFDTREAPTIAVVLGLVFALATLLAPRHGLAPRAIRRSALRLRILTEDVLARLYRHLEAQTDPRHPIGLSWRGLTRNPSDGRRYGSRFSCLLAWFILRVRGELVPGRSGYLLSPDGFERAAGLIRSHRAWEHYLREEVGLALDHLHEPAHRMEHFVPPDLADAILEGPAGTARDPHGRDIPAPRPGDAPEASES